MGSELVVAPRVPSVLVEHARLRCPSLMMSMQLLARYAMSLGRVRVGQPVASSARGVGSVCAAQLAWLVTRVVAINVVVMIAQEGVPVLYARELRLPPALCQVCLYQKLDSVWVSGDGTSWRGVARSHTQS